MITYKIIPEVTKNIGSASRAKKHAAGLLGQYVVSSTKKAEHKLLKVEKIFENLTDDQIEIEAKDAKGQITKGYLQHFNLVKVKRDSSMQANYRLLKETSSNNYNLKLNNRLNVVFETTRNLVSKLPEAKQVKPTESNFLRLLNYLYKIVN